jgi:putative flippase GtrA
MGACILPVLYALLGACAYLLRSLTEQIRQRTFTKTNTHIARFLIAAIAGAVVGMFGNFAITESASIPPLAIAFLVGYAADVFFSFLEGLLQTFTRKGESQVSSVSNS